MQITMELVGEVSEKRLNQEVMPAGYHVEFDHQNVYFVYPDSDRKIVGSCLLLQNSVVVSFAVGRTSGLKFADDFGMRFPDHNPWAVYYSIVYQTPDGNYQLDKLPLMLREEALKEIKHYVATGAAYFVTFYRGNWTKESVFVNSMWPIDIDGSLGTNEGQKMLSLGNIENESTM